MVMIKTQFSVSGERCCCDGVANGLLSQSIWRAGAKNVILYEWSELYCVIGEQKRVRSSFALKGLTGNFRSHVPS